MVVEDEGQGRAERLCDRVLLFGISGGELDERRGNGHVSGCARGTRCPFEEGGEVRNGRVVGCGGEEREEEKSGIDRPARPADRVGAELHERGGDITGGLVKAGLDAQLGIDEGRVLDTGALGGGLVHVW